MRGHGGVGVDEEEARGLLFLTALFIQGNEVELAFEPLVGFGGSVVLPKDFASFPIDVADNAVLIGDDFRIVSTGDGYDF